MKKTYTSHSHKTNKPCKPVKIVYKPVIRKRHVNEGSTPRPYAARIRLSRSTSASLASIQGLIHAYGHGETLAELFEQVAMPAIRQYVHPYVNMAAADRSARIVRRCAARKGGAL